MSPTLTPAVIVASAIHSMTATVIYLRVLSSHAPAAWIDVLQSGGLLLVPYGLLYFAHRCVVDRTSRWIVLGLAVAGALAAAAAYTPIFLHEARSSVNVLIFVAPFALQMIGASFALAFIGLRRKGAGDKPSSP